MPTRAPSVALLCVAGLTSRLPRRDGRDTKRNMAGFVKLHSSILRSTIWFARPDREIFITALLLAEPRELTEDAEQLEVDSLKPTGWLVPAGWYGFVEAAGTGLIAHSGADVAEGYAALRRLGSPELESRSREFDGRRLVRVNHGYVVLNYDKYRERDMTSTERSRRYRERKRLDVPDARGRDATALRSDGTPLATQAEGDAEGDAEAKKEISPLPPEGSLQERADLALRDPTRSSFEKPWEWTEVATVFAAFQKTWRRALTPVRAGLGDPRVRTVLERFREGYSVDELTTAIRGSVKSENLQENPEHQTIQTVLRDGGQIDKWTALLAAAPAQKRSNGREQPRAPNEDFDRRRAEREAKEYEEQMADLRRLQGA